MNKLTAIGLALVLSLAIVFNVVSCATSTPTPSPTSTPTVIPTPFQTSVPGSFQSAIDIPTAREMARTYLLPEASRPVASVNGRPVNRAEFLRGVIQVNANIAFMERIVAENRLGSEVTTAPRLAIMKQYDTNTIAATAVLVRAAELAEAQRQGIQVDEAKVEELVAQQKAVLKSINSPEMDAYMQVIGEDAYWAMARDGGRELLAIQGLQGMVTAGAARFDPQGVPIWSDYRIRLVQSANIVIIDKDLLAGVEQANCVRYLEETLSLPR